MRIEQLQWRRNGGWASSWRTASKPGPQLVLVFGGTRELQEPGLLAGIRATWPDALLAGCSTAGEICGTEVSDGSVVVTAVTFAHTVVRGACVRIPEGAESYRIGDELARALPPSVDRAGGASEPLMHVLVFSDGLHVNGSDLVNGLARRLPPRVTMTGGLAGDGERFADTRVLLDGGVESRAVVAVGLYGTKLRVGFGSLGGWDPFGSERLVTRAKGNVLYELDGQSALGLYKKYLGAHAANLPAAGLLFPLSLRTKPGETPVVRTILAVDETDQSVTFAGDVPQGAYARLMKANFDRLIDGAVEAAQTGRGAVGSAATELALLISCVGRKLVLRQRVEEEVEGVRDVLGTKAVLAGFYSYGEISPFTPGAKCELHNQTMTITTFAEEA